MKDVYRSRLLLSLVAVSVLVIDQLSKAWIASNLTEYATISIASWLDPIISVTPIRNTGGVCGVFPQLGELFKYFSLIVIIVVIFYQRSIPAQQYWVHGALGSVTGGALGNILDRFQRGYVLDYFDVNFWPLKAWPLFNVADSAIVIGVAVMIVDAYFTQDQSVPDNA